MNEFYLEIITPEKSFFEGYVEAAICPTTDGDIEILKGHGEWKVAVVTSGFFEIRQSKVTVFADYCDELADYKEAKLEREKKRQEELELSRQRLLIQKKSDLSLSKYLISSHQTRKNINFK